MIEKATSVESDPLQIIQLLCKGTYCRAILYEGDLESFLALQKSGDLSSSVNKAYQYHKRETKHDQGLACTNSHVTITGKTGIKISE